ncbi:MAG: glutamate--tRNA ligase [Salinisphaeraceae bacterium]|nr:glutamate--tRNA ligase [Salinisphaeraceae bacterium]
MSLTTRFAPSPTGYLHVGGARTALYSWLYARHHGGRFVLRIEDTDRERSTPESIQAILDGMAWLGLDSDAEPVYQTQRFDRYAEVLQKLLDEGKAYRCYCTREEIDAMREQAMARKEKPRYDGRCRERTEVREGVEPVIRFKNPTDGEVVINDLVRGEIRISNSELDDLIIARSDGTPTYNFVVVVDDADMGITHVIRGDDHINNTPRQINILKAIGAEPPAYAHLPMILGNDGKRLSKRHGAVSVLAYRDEGYLPQALLNYLLRLGWSHGDQEVFSREEMIELFELKAVQKAAASFDPDKLNWLNQQHMMNLPPGEVVPHLAWHFDKAGVDTAVGPSLEDLIPVHAPRCKTLVEMVETSRFYFEDFEAYDEKAARKNLKADALQPLQGLRDAFGTLPDWSAEAIHGVVEQVSEALELKMGKVAQPLRVAVSGGAVSPPIDQTLVLLGREKTLARIERALAYIQAQPVE